MNIQTSKPRALSSTNFADRLSKVSQVLDDAKYGLSPLPEGDSLGPIADMPLGKAVDATRADLRRFHEAKRKVLVDQTVGGAVTPDKIPAPDVIDAVHRKATRLTGLSVASLVGTGAALTAAIWGWANLNSGNAGAVVAAVFGSTATIGAGLAAVTTTSQSIEHRASAKRLGQWHQQFSSH